MRFGWLATLFLIPAVLHGQVRPDEPAPPPPPPDVEAELGPEVTITRDGEEMVEEYRVNGQVFMVKITPANGLPYYLIDSDGDGRLETFRNDIEDAQVQQWILFRW